MRFEALSLSLSLPLSLCMQLQSMGHGQVEKRELFLLSQRWLQQWQRFIHCSTLGEWVGE